MHPQIVALDWHSKWALEAAAAAVYDLDSPSDLTRPIQASTHHSSTCILWLGERVMTDSSLPLSIRIPWRSPWHLQRSDGYPPCARYQRHQASRLFCYPSSPGLGGHSFLAVLPIDWSKPTQPSSTVKPPCTYHISRSLSPTKTCPCYRVRRP